MRPFRVLASALLVVSCSSVRTTIESPGATVAVTSAATLTPAPLPTPPPVCDQLTVLPLALADIVAITPLGNLNPSSHVFPSNHLYFNTPRATPAGAELRPVPVTSPGALTVTRVTTQEYRSATPVYTDYKLNFAVCQPITGDLAHLGTVSDRLLAETKKVSPQCQDYATGGTAVRACTYDTKIELAPGERIGLTSAKAALDLGAQDSRVRNAFASPDRYYPEFANAVCPIDLFAQPAFGQLRGKLGREATPKTLVRTIEPVCGAVMQDVAGTAQGNWFAFPGRLTQEDAHLALVHDNVDPRQPLFSVGTSIPELPEGTYPFTLRDTGLVNRDFFQIRSDAKDPKVYCFEGLGTRTNAAKRVVLTMPKDRELRIEVQDTQDCGAGPWTLGPKAVRFER